VLLLAREMGVLNLGTVALDGTASPFCQHILLPAARGNTRFAARRAPTFTSILTGTESSESISLQRGVANHESRADVDHAGEGTAWRDR
jgi:hypothetical protein